MSLSTDVIFDKLNDYFLAKFGMAGGPQTLFRFDKRGSVISEQDFVDPRHPELGCLPALAIEKFSDLANRIPLVCDDNLNLLLSQNSVDQTYFYRLLTPSLPYVPYGADKDTTDILSNSFNTVKAAAMQVWNAATLESLSGMMLEYKPALATPEAWYDRTRDDIWTSESFEVSADAAASPSPQDAGLWKLTPADLTLPAASQVAPPSDTSDQNLHNWLQDVRANPGLQAQLTTPSDESPQGAAQGVSISPDQLDTLDVKDRLLVNDMVADQVQSQPAATNDLTIAFDHCCVTIRRPWWFDAFVNGGNWYIPDVAEGALTMDASPGNMPFVITGMVVIRNLVISGSWDPVDIDSAQKAIGFGPFKVSGGITDGRLTHPSIQTIGWLVESLPVLPPCDRPAPPSVTNTSVTAPDLQVAGTQRQYQPFPGADFFTPGRQSQIIAAMHDRLIAVGCNKYTITIGKDVWGNGDRASYRAWQLRLGYQGDDADGFPGQASWDLLQVPEVAPVNR